jgi:hypothetical protein
LVPVLDWLTIKAAIVDVSGHQYVDLETGSTRDDEAE